MKASQHGETFLDCHEERTALRSLSEVVALEPEVLLAALRRFDDSALGQSAEDPAVRMPRVVLEGPNHPSAPLGDTAGTMSGNLDLVRSIYEDLERGDYSSAETADLETLTRVSYEWVNRKREPTPLWRPDGEFINSREDPDHGVYRGIDAIRKQHQGWFDAYPDLRVEPLEIRTNGDLVFVWTRFTGHGADSGASMEMELAHVATNDGARTHRLEEYFDRHEALKAVGLEDG